jgi:hypothetical protein
MIEDAARQTLIDDEHLKLLSIFYMVSAGLTALFSFFGLLYAAMGGFIGYAITHAPQVQTGPGGPPPEFLGWIFAAFGCAIFVFGMTMAVLKFYVARSLKRRTSRTFCLVIAAFSCLEFPYGTALGVFTFIVLGRPTVMEKFH